jgi:hypothetical protein
MQQPQPRAKRVCTNIAGMVYNIDGQLIAPCRVRNISASGAQIELRREAELPEDVFAVAIEEGRSRPSLRCRLAGVDSRWRQVRGRCVRAEVRCWEATGKDTSVRKSIVSGLTLCVVMTAAQAGAAVKKPIRATHRYPVARAEVGRPAQAPWWIPAHPVEHDCVHVVFPQCGGRGGLNDGSFR